MEKGEQEGEWKVCEGEERLALIINWVFMSSDDKA